MEKIIDLRNGNNMELLLKERNGKKLKAYIHDPFTFSNSVYGRVSFEFDDGYYMLDNSIEVVDYYGADEDVCIFKFKKIQSDDVKSALAGVVQEVFPVNESVKQIVEIIETSSMYEESKKTYEMIYIKAVMFVFDDDRQVIFERTDDFSESISIVRGNAIDIESMYEVGKEEEIVDEGVKFIICREKKIIQ